MLFSYLRIFLDVFFIKFYIIRSLEFFIKLGFFFIIFDVLILIYYFGIIFCNIIIYLITSTILFTIIFFIDYNLLKTLNDLKNLAIYPFLTSSLLFGILSLAGIPPLFGFIGKFLLASVLFSKQQYILIVI